MRPEPTQAHFDPEAMTLMVTSASQGPALRAFHFETPGDSTYWNLPGRVTLRDRLDKIVEFYTFGAKLRAAHLAAPSPWTLYVLESSAPIVAVTTSLSLSGANQLVEEVEALFARLRPDERRNGQGLMDALVGIEPIYVYAGCIEHIYGKYRQTPVLQHMFPTLFRLLQHEEAWLHDQVGERLLAIDALVRNPPPFALRVDRTAG